jgi:hypothetical protein
LQICDVPPGRTQSNPPYLVFVTVIGFSEPGIVGAGRGH